MKCRKIPEEKVLMWYSKKTKNLMKYEGIHISTYNDGVKEAMNQYFTDK